MSYIELKSEVEPKKEWKYMIQQSQHLNGQLREELPLRNGYREAAAKDKTRYRGSHAVLQPRRRVSEKQILRVFTTSLLENPNRCEARKWLKIGDQTGRSLGRFKHLSEAIAFVEKLYDAGAVEIIVSDIYANKAGDQFADCLLVRLPKGAKRKAIRRVCAQLDRRDLGAVQPDIDIGETHLYLSSDQRTEGR